MTVQATTSVSIAPGVWRTRADDPPYRRYYLIVEAIDENGQRSTLEIANHETGLTRRVVKWGIEVTQEVYDRFAEDKRDDGVIQNRRVGSVSATSLRPQYSIPTSGLTITEW